LEVKEVIILFVILVMHSGGIIVLSRGSLLNWFLVIAFLLGGNILHIVVDESFPLEEILAPLLLVDLFLTFIS
jgi:hypothetical protein